MPSGLEAALHSVASNAFARLTTAQNGLSVVSCGVYQLQLHVQGCGIDEQSL